MTGVLGGFSEGAGTLLLAIPGAPQVRPLICYEIIFPDEIAQRGERPGWLLNLTNDAWFGSSAGPYQHFHQARVRAVEQGLPLVRAANTGISAVIDAHGRILAEIGLGESGVADANLPHAIARTSFVQFGSIVETSLLALAFIGWLACRARPLRSRRTT
jgi:apolipoprotein N-acyltransferase